MFKRRRTAGPEVHSPIKSVDIDAFLEFQQPGIMKEVDRVLKKMRAEFRKNNSDQPTR